MAKKYHVISHTHWDREWYKSFEVFRIRLVTVIDQLLDIMETNEEYKFFHLDGCTALVKDYLEIRPENKNRLSDLIKAGRILIGPWYTMPDEFLVSGESLIRNLEKGREICSEFGVEPMSNGYLVDIFGHNSQMPQILNLFGIKSATLFRGIGDYEKDLFNWVGKDQSTVICAKLCKVRSYSDFFFALRNYYDNSKYTDSELIERMNKLSNIKDSEAACDHILTMDGVDHINADNGVTEIVKTLQKNGFDIEQANINEYFSLIDGSSLEDIHGELYEIAKDGINNSLLQNTLSAMVHLKQMNCLCETLLLSYVEPFAIMANKYSDSSFVKHAWELLLQNHAHDSICGCSITQVHKDMECRFASVLEICEELFHEYQKRIISDVDFSSFACDDALVVFNPLQKKYQGSIKAEIILKPNSQGLFRLYDINGKEVPYQIIDKKINVFNEDYHAERLIDFPVVDKYEIVFEANIPSMGYCAFGYKEFENNWPTPGKYDYETFYKTPKYLGDMSCGNMKWENEFYVLSVETDYTLSIKNKATNIEYKDIIYLEDSADVGDGWRYVTPLQKERSYLKPKSVEVLLEGQLLTRLSIEFSSEVHMVLDLYKHNRIINFTIHVTNTKGNHRLRALINSGILANEYFTDTPFSLEKRLFDKKDYQLHNENNTYVVPNQGAIYLNKDEQAIAVYNKGLYESEVTEYGTIAVTLFRAFPKEVYNNTPDMCNMQRKMSFELGIAIFDKVQPYSTVILQGQEFKAPLRSICTKTHGGKKTTSYSALIMSNEAFVVTSFRYKNDKKVEIRLFNCSDEQQKGELEVNLHDSVKKILLDAEPWSILTLDIN